MFAELSAVLTKFCVPATGDLTENQEIVNQNNIIQNINTFFNCIDVSMK